MIRICFFSGDITRSGGTERAASLIANGLAQQNRYEILFLSLVEQREKPFFPLGAQIRHEALGKKWIRPGLGYLGILPKLRRFLKKQHIDVLVDIDLVLDILSIPACVGLGTRVISWGHFSFYFERESLYRRWIQRFSAARADYVVTINQENLVQYGIILKRTDRIRTIYNPAVPSENLGDEETPEKEKWLLSVGRLVPLKGFDYLLDVASCLYPQFPDWKWIVVGDGELRQELEAACRQRGLEDFVQFIGAVDYVDRYYRSAAVFVLTSRSEGLPMCLLEAKANDLPCVSFDIPTGPREIIAHGQNGYLIPPFDCQAMADRLKSLMEDETLRRSFADHAKDGREKFEIGDILKSWNEVIREVTEARAEPPVSENSGQRRGEGK